MDKSTLKETYAVHKDGELQMNIYPQGYSDVLYHWHDELEFIYVSSGACDCVIGGEGVTVNEGEAALVQAGELHTLSTDPKKTEAIAIVIHPNVIAGSDSRKYFSGSIKFKRILRPETEAEKRILENLRKMNECFNEKKFAYELRLKALIADIFSLMFEHNLYSRNTQTSSETLKNFEKIIEYVHNNFSEELSLEDIAKFSGYSKAYVIRLFKTNTGRTPVEYINRYRIYKAQEMLSHTDKNIIDVAMECGICNIGYFIRLFKKYTGTTPYKYKRNMTN